MLLLAACTGLPKLGGPEGALTPVAAPAPSPDPDATRPLIGPGRAIALPAPSELGRDLVATQLITATAAGQTVTFEANLKVSRDQLLLVALDGMGRRGVTVRWDGATLTAETAPWLPAGVRPGSLLADMTVLYFPSAAVRKAVAAAGCDLAISGRTRAVRCADIDVIRADYDGRQSAPWTGKLRYSNLAWGYEVEVQSAAQP